MRQHAKGVKQSVVFAQMAEHEPDLSFGRNLDLLIDYARRPRHRCRVLRDQSPGHRVSESAAK